MINCIASSFEKHKRVSDAVIKEGLVSIQNLCVWEDGASFVLKSEVVLDALFCLWNRFKNRKSIQRIIRDIIKALKFVALKSNTVYPVEKFSIILNERKKYILINEL